MNDSLKILASLFFGILIVYMVLAAQFESFLYPFIIMLALPLSLIGALGLSSFSERR